MTDDVDWDDYESGPFCRHWSDPGDCDELCANCKHKCHGDECREDGCNCTEWKESA